MTTSGPAPIRPSAAPHRTSDDEDPELRAAVLATSRSILAAQQRAERELLAAREALRRQNNALTSTNAILQATLDATPVGVMVADGAGRLTLRNGRFDDLWPLQWPSAELHPALDSVLPAMQAQLTDPAAMATWLAQLKAGDGRSHELSCQTLDGRHLQCHALPQMLAQQPVGMVFNWLDVTERVQAEALRSQVHAGELAAQTRAQFISRASHELRAPLNAVLGFSQLLELNPLVARDADAMRYVGHIRTAGGHLQALMDDLMQVTQLDAGTLPLRLQVLDMYALACEMLALMQPMADAQGITLVAPASEASPLEVLGDTTRVRQVLLNLLSNAIKYNRARGRVSLRFDTAPGLLRLAIDDTGIGMSAHQLAHLFEPFNRLGAERSATEGTGLGLAITRQLVRAMNGTLDVHSVPDQGSRFVLGLPCPQPSPGSD